MNQSCLDILKKYQVLCPDKNRTYIDIGSGNGVNVVGAAALFKNVYAYEPSESCCSQIEENIKNNGVTNIQLTQCPVYCKPTSGNLVLDSQSDCRYFEEGDGDIQSRVLDFENIHLLDFLKVDTFGNEILILKGATQLLKRCKPLIQVALTSYKWTTDNDNVIQFLSEMGYTIFGNSSDGHVFLWIPEKNDNIENRIIYCFWTGTNTMTHNRLGCMFNLRTQTEATITLVTADNLHTYLIAGEPLHEAYQYLSETHRCDYLRIYFMHFYGGGYTDIKSPRRSWQEAFKQMSDDPTKIINGYHEKGEWCVAYPPVKDKWPILCGNGSYILRPKTALTYAWYRAMLAKMDEHVAALRLNPSSRYEDCKELGTGYPLEWNEMLGRIFHRVLSEFEGYILYTTPKPYGGWYR